MLYYDLTSVFAIGFLLLPKWSYRSRILETFGRFSYEIYLWHILVLLYIAWQVPAVLATCTKYPEVILVVVFLTCALIALTRELLQRQYAISALSFLVSRLERLIDRLKSSPAVG